MAIKWYKTTDEMRSALKQEAAAKNREFEVKEVNDAKTEETK